MTTRDKFLMGLTIGICVAIVTNSIVNNDDSLVRNLMLVLAYWMPSPITQEKHNTYIVPPASSNTESGL